MRVFVLFKTAHRFCVYCLALRIQVGCELLGNPDAGGFVSPYSEIGQRLQRMRALWRELQQTSVKSPKQQEFGGIRLASLAWLSIPRPPIRTAIADLETSPSQRCQPAT
jgi:hypothetical protein